MLLPAATGAAQRSKLFVAVAGDEARIVGAAALGLDSRPEMQRGWQVDLRVIVPLRRRGIGRALMERVVEQARAHAIPALHGWEWVEPEGEAARAWAAFEFAPCQRRLEFATDLASSVAQLMPLYNKLWEDQWIPPSARIIPLSEADVGAVADLHVQHLGGSRRLLMPLLRGGGADRYDAKYSRVLLLDGRVMGFTLGRVRADGVCEIEANVLHPSLRRGWADLLLKLEAGQLLLANGFHTIRYFSLQQHTDTHRITRKVGGRLVGTLVQMRRELSPPAGGPEDAAASASGAGT
jgi:GNAT superfamily N-acetyltransferase